MLGKKADISKLGTNNASDTKIREAENKIPNVTKYHLPNVV